MYYLVITQLKYLTIKPYLQIKIIMGKIKFVLLLLVLLVAVSCTNFSEGERVGIITEFSYSGKVFKSYEGELKIAPNAANQGMIGQYETFAFSVDNDKTVVCITPIDSIKEYARLGIPVSIAYQEVAFLNWFSNRGDTDYYIKSVSRLPQ